MADTTKPSTTVYVASFAALMGALGMGLALGYTATCLIDMDRDKNSTIFDTDEKVRASQKSQIGSMLAVGALVGGLLSEPANKMLGRRFSLVLFGIPFALGWLLIALANGLTMIILGRIITGLCCGLISGTAPTYVVEIAPPQIRGLLGTCFQVMVVIGILLAAVLGTIVSWKAVAGISIIACVVMSLMMMFMPETPQWLLSKSRNEDAEQSLKRLRVSAINSEFNMLTQSAQGQLQSGSQYSLAVLKSREFYIPFAFALALMFFQQFSGINAVVFYQGIIFKKAAPKSDAAVLTIYVCIAQVIATIAGSALVDRLGRKILLLASGIGHAVSLIVFGWYFHTSATDENFRTNYAWISLASLIVFISSFSVGYGPIPWMMIPELSSSKVRSMIASLATAFNWACVYVVTGFIDSLINGIGDAWTYWLFAIISAISCIFVGFLLPETKGRTSEQIQREILGQNEADTSLAEPNSLKAIA